jgi:hypothetical protein
MSAFAVSTDSRSDVVSAAAGVVRTHASSRSADVASLEALVTLGPAT